MYTSQVTDEQELVVRTEASNISALEGGAFNLQERLDEASQQGIKTLVFEAEEYEFERALAIQRSLTITSRLPNSTKTRLSCREANQIFKIERNSEDVTVELRRLKITNFTTLGPDGVIHVGSGARIVFDDVELVNNVADGINHSIVMVDSNATLEVRGGSSFSNNKGRVILVGNGSEVIIENSAFSHNTAETNGTVLSTKPGGGTQLSVRGSFFKGNEARGSSGGVMWLKTSNVTLENGVQFISNVADHDGGALFLNDSLGLRISDTMFQNNSCHLGKGGAIFIVPSNNSDTRVGRSAFVRNSANGAMGMGGAIAFGNTNLGSIRQFELASDVLFLKNTARISGGAVLVYETRTRLYALSAFISNSAHGSAGGLHMFSSETDFIQDGYVDASISNASFISNRASRRGGGAMFISGAVYMTMSNSICSRNSGREGGAMRVFYARTVVLRDNCLFERNKATERGGSVRIRGTDATITDSRFIENESKRGGSLSIKDGDTFHAQNCTFEGNKASNGGGAIRLENLEIIRGRSTRVTLRKIVFRNNTSLKPQSREGFGGAVLINGAGISAIVKDCLFEHNTAHWGGSLYLAEGHTTEFVNTSFTNNIARLGGALYIVPSERDLRAAYHATNLRSCFLRENTATRGGAIFACPASLNSWEISEVSNSFLNIEDSSFLQNRASDFGGGLFLALTNGWFTRCLFRNNTANRWDSETTTSTQVAIATSAGGAVFASNGSSVSLTDTTFIANSASGRGGALCTEDAFVNCSRNCTFLKNQGRNGGGIFCSLSSMRYNANQPGVLHCTNCSFQRNNAKRGGGIYASIPMIKPNAQLSQACQRSNSSRRNRAGRYSAIEDCKDLILLDPIRMEDNSASVTGHAVFSTQPKAIMVATRKERMNLVQYFSTIVNKESSNYTFASIAHNITRRVGYLRDLNRGSTGQAFRDLEFHVLDFFNQSVKGSRIVAELWQCQNNSECCSSEAKRYNAEDFAASGQIIASRIATNGLASFDGLEISDNRDGNTEFPLWACVTVEADDQVSLAPILLNVSFRECYTLERRSPENGGCSECDPGQYYVNESGNCTNCPEHATCRGLTIIPDGGYWHATSVSHRIYKCHPREACVKDKEGHREIIVTEAHKQRNMLNWIDPKYDQCSSGYEGILCGSCKEDHGRWNSICAKCQSVPLMWISFVASIIWNLFILLVFIYSAQSLIDRVDYNKRASSHPQDNLVSDHSRPEETQQNQRTPRMTDSFLRSNRRQSSVSKSAELTTMPAETQNSTRSTRRVHRQRRFRETIASEPLPLTNPLSEALKIVLNFMQVIYLAALLSEDLPSFFRWSIIPFDSLNLTETVFLIADCLLKRYEDRAIIRMTLQALFPLLLFLLVCLVPALILLFRKRIKFGLQEVKIVALCTVYLYFGPEIRTLLKFLDGSKVEDDNVNLGASYFWSVDTSVKFLQGYHVFVFGLIALPLLIAFVIGFPFSLLISLKKNKDRMQEEDVVSCYGFLYKGYKSKYYYWEIVIVMRKTVIAVLCVFVQNIELQSVFISLTLVFFLSLQLIVSPFSSDFPGLNILESLSLSVSTMVFFGVTSMLTSHELNKKGLLHAVAWFTILVLFVTVIAMGLGLFAATQDFLNDKLIEKGIYSSKQSVELLPITTKVFKLLAFYFGYLHSCLEVRPHQQHSVSDASEV